MAAPAMKNGDWPIWVAPLLDLEVAELALALLEDEAEADKRCVRCTSWKKKKGWEEAHYYHTLSVGVEERSAGPGLCSWS
jgi:hypothetical protein